MRITSIVFAGLLAVAMAHPAMAKNKYDSSPLFKEVDTDKDGKISLVEWKAVGLPDMVFNALDQNHDGFITRDEFDGSQAPDGLDKNHDGKLTLEAFKEHVKKMAEGGGGQGGPGGGPGGPGGAPPSGAPPQQ
jgi:Ca2+-binding EF-hand superfamily protein